MNDRKACWDGIDEEWNGNFRMSKNNFNFTSYLTNFVVIIQRRVIQSGRICTVEIQVTVILYFLSDCGRVRKIANAFGLASCTVPW